MRMRFLVVVEIVLLSAVILAARCANYGEVFINGNIYFADGDCYARMTRARLCLAQPGKIVRWHDFENFPAGISPHTTAPFDYLIVVLAMLWRPFSPHALDLAGAFISPFLSVVVGIFLCLWSRAFQLRFRWALLLLFAVSPILAHGFALGRPDHQSLLIALVAIGWCAEWTLVETTSRHWSITSGLSWGVALWVSLYEPTILLAATVASLAVFHRSSLWRRDRLWSAAALASVLILAALVERRFPFTIDTENLAALRNWTATIGELRHVPWTGGLWWQWCGLGLLGVPLLFWKRRSEFFLSGVFLVTFALTLWQARWGYFFALAFCLLLPRILDRVRRPRLAWIGFALSLIPIMVAWEATLDDPTGLRGERRSEMVALHEIAMSIDKPFLAPWWFSPALAYWSRQPCLGGSSHESIAGNRAIAEFYATADSAEALTILREHRPGLVVAYDADRISSQVAALRSQPTPERSLALILDREPSQAPKFLRLIEQTSPFKLYSALNLLEK